MSNEATTMAEAMERKHSEPATPAPSALEIEAYALTLKNGIELGLGKQDPGIAIAAKLQAQYPHHLVLLQDGAFLHAYGKSAYFLHALKKYKLTVVGPESAPNIRCGLPVAAHKRRLWHVVEEYKVPYVVALGTRATYVMHISKEDVQSSLMDDIPPDIVRSIIEGLSQTDKLRVAKAVQMLLNPAQRTFRLKEVTLSLYKAVMQRIATLPNNHRYFLGKDVSECMARIMRAVYVYPRSTDRSKTLNFLSGEIDLLKDLFVAMHQMGKPTLLQSTVFSVWSAMAIEMGDLVAGLLYKNEKGEKRSPTTSPATKASTSTPAAAL